MESTSRFIQLQDEILVEYIYSNLSPSDFISTIDQPIWNLKDSNLNISQLLFDDSFENSTTNVRDLSVVRQSDFYFTSLDIDVPLPFNDFNPNLTNTIDLEVNFNTPQQYVLEEIRFHLVTGYDFPNSDGFIFKVSVNDKENRELILSNIAWLKSDNNFTINTSPFLISDRLYDKFLSVKILGISQIIDEFELNPSDSDNIGYQISRNNLGINVNTTLKFEAWKISKIVNDGIYKNYYITDYTISSLPIRDDFFSLSSILQESSNGDYFEYYATWNGEFIEDRIFRLNSIGNNYIIIHEITTIEQIGNTFIQTNRFTDVQLNNYDEPNTFRPIIKNANSATSYSLEYVMRLFNKNDNSQIIRRSTFTSMNVNKYGRFLSSINISNNNTSLKVYNKIEKNNEFNIPTFTNQVGTIIKQVPVFIQNKNISVKNGDQNTISSNIKGQGRSQIVIDMFDNVIRFILSENVNNDTIKLIKLSSNVVYKLVFFDNNNNQIIIESGFENLNENLSQGELYFNISSNISKQILKSNNKNFYIIASSNGLNTKIYQGLWVNSINEVDETVNEQLSDDITTNETIKKIEEDLKTKQKIIEANPKNTQTGNTSWMDIKPLDE